MECIDIILRMIFDYYRYKWKVQVQNYSYDLEQAILQKKFMSKFWLWYHFLHYHKW